MGWVKHYHDDHMAVLHLLAKLEGNIKLIEVGQDTPGTMLEFQEFARILEEVVIPHFKSEEQHAYVKAREKDDSTGIFIAEMLEEHEILHVAFKNYLEALKIGDKGKIAQTGAVIVDVLHKHIIKEEKDLPALLRE